MSEAEIYNNYSIEPLVQSLDEVKQQFEHYIFLKIVDDNMIIGSVRAQLIDETCAIGKLMVHPLYQNQGIAKKLMSEIELCYDIATRYELFTGSKSEKNIQLYQKTGYEIFKTTVINNDVRLIYLEKLKVVM